jgi:NAD(P)-dependent dehydrogenase (short-subunit alcohol dehydrogenase family)
MSKLVCISGCSRGLGRAMAKEFQSRGWNVAGGARDTDALKKLKREMIGSPFLHTFDITKPKQVDIFAQLVREHLGVPDLLINNAGLINKNAPLSQISPEEFTAVLAVNLGGIHNMIRSFVPLMEKVGRGVIVNFSSYWGQSSAPEVGPYCASKWGVEGLTRSLAQELPVGLTTVAFNPGIIDTDMLRSCFGDSAKTHEKPNSWAKHAVDRLESLNSCDNGKTVLG